MRGDVIYRVYGVHQGRAKDSFFGAFRSRAEAEARIAVLDAEEMDGRSWAEQYHDDGFVVREAVIGTDFEIPPRPGPRDRYFVRTAPRPNRPGTWDSTHVEVCRRDVPAGQVVKVCDYVRDHAMLQTFEPFRQGKRELALISRHHTRTAVLDLATGNVIAEEDEGRKADMLPTRDSARSAFSSRTGVEPRRDREGRVRRRDAIRPRLRERRGLEACDRPVRVSAGRMARCWRRRAEGR
jgi:hypothetical protein